MNEINLIVDQQKQTKKKKDKGKMKKWTAEEYIKFLELFQKYPILYNASLEEYHNKTLATSAIQNLLKDVIAMGES